MKVAEWARCPGAHCKHLAADHGKGDGGSKHCAGRVVGENVHGSCGCMLLAGEVLEDAFGYVYDMICGDLEGERLQLFAKALGVGDVGPDGCRVVLYSDPGLAAWRELISWEGWRSDERALKVLRMALTFPTIRAGVESGKLALAQGWSALELERWCVEPSTTAGGRHSARFVLGCWNRQHVFSCGTFDLHDAMATWDGAHQRAFCYWAAKPWWV